MAGYAESSWSISGRIGHHASSLLNLVIVAVVLERFFPPPGLLLLTVPLALFAVAIGSYFLMRSHNRRLCEHCASTLPLDAAGQAARYKRRMWVCHKGLEARYVVPYLIVLIGTNFLTSMPGMIIWAAVQLSMIWLVVSTNSHRMLQPWCRYCNGRGDTEITETDPVLPSDDRQLA
jgi:hypothetical protein